MVTKSSDPLRQLTERISRLGKNQVALISSIVEQLEKPKQYTRKADSDLVSVCLLGELGDSLRIHHCFSNEPFTKDKFEYALERACGLCSVPATRSTRGYPGHDITIRGVPISLKTQADKSIKLDYIHISKFMELGKGEWGSDVRHLHEMRQRFFDHMRNYERIFTLRKLKTPNQHTYELVEIPKALLLQSSSGVFSMDTASRQTGAKPGTCTVVDQDGTVFQLYFDGGSERKLQVRQLRKSLCVVHATWAFAA